MGSWLPSRRLALVVLLVVQLLSCVSLFVITWVAAHQARLFTVFWSLLKFMSIESVMVSNHLILCCPLLLLPSNFPSIFSNESVLHITWPKYWSFSLNISPSNEYSWLISFRPFRYDLSQIPYDYTVEVRNRFKGLDLIDGVPERTMDEERFVTLYRRW